MGGTEVFLGKRGRHFIVSDLDIFIEKLKCDNGFTQNSNWTEITFKNDYADFISYKRFNFRVSLFDPLKILRDERLKSLGL